MFCICLPRKGFFTFKCFSKSTPDDGDNQNGCNDCDSISNASFVTCVQGMESSAIDSFHPLTDGATDNGN